MIVRAFAELITVRTLGKGGPGRRCKEVGSATFGDLVVLVDMLEVIQAGQGAPRDIKVTLEDSSILSRG